MLEHDATDDDNDSGQPTPQDASSTQDSPTGSGGGLNLPKNRSTGNLLEQAAKSKDGSRIRFSFDAGSMMEYETATVSPIIAEHEHGLGTSGLRRIRQQPPLRTPTLPSAESSFTSQPIPRSSSMVLSLPSRSNAGLPSAGPASPTLQFGEDLSRFPSESLHSFSFAHQSEDSLHHRQNILKRSIDFMRDRLGWAASNSAIANAQARISGDVEIQSMLELLSRANLAGKEPAEALGLGLNAGPMTGPALVDGQNIFDKSFLPRSESPENLDKGSKPSSRHGSVATPSKQPSDKEGTVDTQLSVKDAERPIALQPAPISEDISEQILSGPVRTSLKRTYTDISPLSLQTKLLEALAQPYQVPERADGFNLPSAIVPSFGTSLPSAIATGAMTPGPSVHGHASRWAPAAQAIFTTQGSAPWTILAANDLACLVFGVTKAEVRKIGIMEVVQEERRSWLEEKLAMPGTSDTKTRPKAAPNQSQKTSPSPSSSSTSSLLLGGGVTAQLLSKPPSRYSNAARRAKTDDGSGSTFDRPSNKSSPNHSSSKSRGVLLCGDVVPILKRNGATGSASLWVKEKRGGLIWVLEEIVQDAAYVDLDANGRVLRSWGEIPAIWGIEKIKSGSDIGALIPQIPRARKESLLPPDYEAVTTIKQFTGLTAEEMRVPLTVELGGTDNSLRISSFPHIAGIMVLNASSLKITSSNAVFSAALFGQPSPEGHSITELIPAFERILKVLTEEDRVRLVDGIVIPEHSFRRARAVLALREGKADAANVFLRPSGLLARHRDGSEIKVDLQMRVVKSESFVPDVPEDAIQERSEDGSVDEETSGVALTEVVYALWITYSRHLHSAPQKGAAISPLLSRPGTPPHQPSPGQTSDIGTPGSPAMGTDSGEDSRVSLLSAKIKEATSEPIQSSGTLRGGADDVSRPASSTEETSPDDAPHHKKTIEDFVILEEMGQGAYGQVKLARYKQPPATKVVLKYVTKRRILVDTWTRDRRLGTVPLEIHVLDYLRRDGLKHPNIVEMVDFFEDNVNYYIEMVPHGLPGMDLFDYIELRVNMDEAECRSIFTQVVDAIHHLHTKALVVHRDIKDENVVLDGEGRIKLIDFGSAAYIKNGPFDVFVGTIDYAAPEVLAGRPYRGKEQDVWALGILLYTIVYKENPFYSIDEIMDHDLRVPYIMSEHSIDLIRGMLDRDVDQRFSITRVWEHEWCRPGE